jgi:hypothetical protein
MVICNQSARWTSAVVAGVLLLIGGLVLGTSAASAHGYGYSGTGLYLPDSSDDWYCFFNNIPDAQPYHDAEIYLDSATEMYRVYTSTCGPSTDKMFLRNDSLTDPSGNPARGVAQCVNANVFVCDAFWVAVNYVEIWSNTVSRGGDGDNFNFNVNKTIRHEVGHTAGMWHTPALGTQTPCGADVTDTMVQGWVATSLPYLLYNNHHICHVNGWV